MPRSDKRIFSKVAVARELLRDKAAEILEEYLDVVQKAKDSGDYETAAKSLQWLIEHMPADDSGGRLVEASVDKKQEVVQTGPSKPSIQIGIAVGGLGQKTLPEKPKELPVTVEVVDSE